MVWLLTQSQTSWSVKSSGSQEALLQNKAGGDDGIPAELFQILKDDAVEVLHSVCQQIWKTQQWPQDQKGSVFIPIPKKGAILLGAYRKSIAMTENEVNLQRELQEAEI